MERSIVKDKKRPSRVKPIKRQAGSMKDIPDIDFDTDCLRFQAKHPCLKDWVAKQSIVHVTYDDVVYDTTMLLFYPSDETKLSFHTEETEEGAQEYYKWGCMVNAGLLPLSITGVCKWSLGFCRLKDGTFVYSKEVEDPPLLDYEVYILDVTYVVGNVKRTTKTKSPTDHIRDVIRKKTQNPGFVPDGFPETPRLAVLTTKTVQRAMDKVRLLSTPDDEFDEALHQIMMADNSWSLLRRVNPETIVKTAEALETSTTDERVAEIDDEHLFKIEHMPNETDVTKTSVWRALFQAQESASIPFSRFERPCIVYRSGVGHFTMWKVI